MPLTTNKDAKFARMTPVTHRALKAVSAELGTSMAFALELIIRQDRRALGLLKVAMKEIDN